VNVVLTAAETREFDRVAIDDHGIPGILLMEHAATAVARRARALAGPGGRFFVVAGGGQNGGDGYAAARLLLSEGREACVLAVVPPERLAGDAALQARIFASIGGEVRPFEAPRAGPGDVVIDALLGTGLSRPPRGAFAEAIAAMNAAREAGAKVLCVDLPSGVSADTGEVLETAVRGDATVTFGAWKRGLLCHPGAALAGEVEVAPISWPPGILDRLRPAVRLLDDEGVRALLPARRGDAHKGSFGHCLVVAGSVGKTGAAALAGLGALVGGAGLCTVASRPPALVAIQAHAMELMGHPLPGEGPLAEADLEALRRAAEGKDAILVGPGIPRGGQTGALLEAFLAEFDGPVVLDADALNALAGSAERLRRARGPVVITPHPGEMARLVGTSIAEVQRDRIEVARGFARNHGCTVVLKGAGTVVADPDGEAAICSAGNPGMATGGSGDVLGGLLASLLAQGMTPGEAARAAVHVHAKAGDLVRADRGMAGLLASDLLEGIRRIWVEWER
jgi:NAD(P)H-hydrate epimerase